MLRTIRFFLSSRKSWTIPYVIFSAIFVILPLLLIVVYAFMAVESSAAIAFQALALIPADICDNIVIGCQYEDERDQKNGDKLA